MHALFNYYKNTLFAICYISLLTGCGTAYIATEKPFMDPIASITPGQTTRESVHALLGNPSGPEEYLWPSIDEGNVEVFSAMGDAIGLVFIFPFPSGEAVSHHALITYDVSGHVDATDWGYALYEFTSMFLYAGEYGYFNGTNTVFPSKDGGGKADKAWADYMIQMMHEIKYQYGSWDKERALKLICRAVEQSHPAAYSELGHLFRENRWLKGLQQAFGYYALSPIKKDNVKACFWYSMANDKVQPPWCRDLLTMEESTEVEYLLENWQPGQCEHEIDTAITGS